MNNGQPRMSGLKRRQFLEVAWAASLLVMGGEALAALLKFIQPVLAGGFGGVVRAGRVEEFTPGSISHVKSGRFYLHRLEDGSFLAMWQRCTHLGCSVPWVEDEGQFHCPCHGSLFNEKGEVLGGPAPRPLDVFPVTVEDGQVWVDTGRPIQRARFDPGQTAKV